MGQSTKCRTQFTLTSVSTHQKGFLVLNEAKTLRLPKSENERGTKQFRHQGE